MEKKRRQHYVFRYYLNSWANPRVYCLQNNSIFAANLMKLANQRDFYRLKDLTELEEEFIRKAFINTTSNLELKEAYSRLLQINIHPFKFQKHMQSMGLFTEELEKAIDVLINNLEEEYHASIESILIPFLDKLNCIDSDFILTKEEYNNFNFALSVQYFRTKRNRSYMIKEVDQQLEKNPQMKDLAKQYGFNIENIYQIITNMFAISLAYSINSQSDQYHYVTLKNDTTIPLISGDQPVVNTQADYRSDTAPTKFELYYPISPTKGLLLTREDNFKAIRNYNLSAEEVHHYNDYVFRASEHQLFANEEQILCRYKSNTS